MKQFFEKSEVDEPKEGVLNLIQTAEPAKSPCNDSKAI